MRSLFSLLLFSFPLLSWSNTHFSTQIHDIDFGDKQDEDILIFLNNGHVTKIPKWDATLLQEVSEARDQKSFLDIGINTERFIQDIEEKETPEEVSDEVYGSYEKNNYVPTIIPSLAEAKKVFRSARYYSKDSQCFNRAHIWSFEWWKKSKINSNKILIYFSRNYIRRYNFEWWFHIAPYVHVNENGETLERVMDVKYTSGPLKFRNWSNIFMRNDAVCPVITKYSDYADFPYHGDCFIQRTNMYTYQPADLQMNEAFGYNKTQWIPREVNGAYLEAFDETVDITPDLEEK